MGIYNKQGYRRLAILIAIITFIATYTILVMTTYSVDEADMFVVIPIVSSLWAAGVFVLTRIVYWVIDGFISKDKE